jgi:hypothetical protein
MNEVGTLPTFTAGLLHGGLKVAGARDIRIEFSGYDGHACTYRVQWSDTAAAPGISSGGGTSDTTQRPPSGFV